MSVCVKVFFLARKKKHSQHFFLNNKLKSLLQVTQAVLVSVIPYYIYCCLPLETFLNKKESMFCSQQRKNELLYFVIIYTTRRVS